MPESDGLSNRVGTETCPDIRKPWLVPRSYRDARERYSPLRATMNTRGKASKRRPSLRGG
ncbi:hypothetical protein SAMN05192568_102274 [Methylobacterium pseudosasicola]|uniref:Uncharacterized protein n=1 Tax=Methylobacterium pseudosasicola TaxID=582667 RepID=A0A1I4NX93_9HYPH|nr:hypothetical protein SAMN05192568_102274 [Methylobacterium pseudosasicola]